MFTQLTLGGLFGGTLVSLLVHVGTGGGMYYWFVMRQPAPIVAELDLSETPLIPPAPVPGGAQRRQPPQWILPKKQKSGAPAVKPPPPSVETKEEVKALEEAPAAPCVNCSETAPISVDPGYILAADAARKPKWISNFITASDYPAIARQQVVDGLVVLSVIIDNEGVVRDVQLVKGAHEALNDVAMRKTREARFSPAYNREGRAVPCKMILPIRFNLR